MDRIKSRVLMFGILQALLIVYPYQRIIFNRGMNENSLYVFGLMWMPAVAGVITKLYFDKTLKGGLGLAIRKRIYTV